MSASERPLAMEKVAHAKTKLALDEARAEVERLREALEGLLPSPVGTKSNVVERHLCMGRMWLRVAGAYVAIEGSQCFDGDYGENVHEVRRWTGEDFRRIEERFAAPIRAALASTPGPTEREMRVAEAVRKEAMALFVAGGVGWSAISRLDLRAIAAKAVKL